MRPSSRCVDSNEQKSILRGYWPPSLVQGRVLVVGESSTKDRLVAELGGVLCLLYPMQWFGPGHGCGRKSHLLAYTFCLPIRLQSKGCKSMHNTNKG